MNAAQIAALARKLLDVASAFHPGAAAIREVLEVANELNAQLKAIREQDPDVWAEISREYPEALAAFDASQPRA